MTPIAPNRSALSPTFRHSGARPRPVMADHFNACEWLVDRQVEAGQGQRTALLCGDAALTYEELLGSIRAAAGGLRRLGVRPEERVLMILRDGPELAVAVLAAMRIGAIALPVNTLLPSRDLVAIARDSRARCAIVPGDAGALIAALSEGAPDLTALVRVGLAAEADRAGPLWSEVLAAGGDGSADDTSVESPCFWLCTSGTTGRPKLAMHRHADVRTTCDGYAREVLDVQPGDRHLSVAPMFHAYGFGNSLTFPLSAGAQAVLEPTRPPTPALVAALMERHRATLFFAVPGASGTPVGGHAVRLLDDEGVAVPVDSPGQLWVSGPAAATGYWCRSDETRRTFVGDWVATGDLYSVDSAGIYRHLGRRDDMLRVAGEWVSPAEVESVLLGSDCVAEVAAVGAVAADGLTRTVAFAVARPGVPFNPDAVLARCRAELAGYKRPRRLIVVDTLPKTATGKVIRAELRREATRVLTEAG